MLPRRRENPPPVTTTPHAVPMKCHCRVAHYGRKLQLFSLPSLADGLYQQPPFTETELNQFIDTLPRFREWVKANKEKTHPIVNDNGEPDILYSEAAAETVRAAGWKPERFFCVMGRAAAAVAIIQQGNAITKTPPIDMPNVSDDELDLVRRHLPTLLKAVNQTPTPKK